MNEKLRKIINYYGIEKQLKYFQTKVFELNEQIIKERNKGVIEKDIDTFLSIILSIMNSRYKNNSKEHIKEEIADVMVMLKQFQLYYDISTNDIRDIMSQKINRQLERIKIENVKMEM